MGTSMDGAIPLSEDRTRLGSSWADLTIREFMKVRSDHIEMMCAAYLKATDIPPSEVELVEIREWGATRWFFRKKEDK